MRIAVELLVTERSYVDSLNMMCKKYMEPMLAHAQSKKPLITTEQIKSVFSITETLYTYHSMLLEGLERRIRDWSEESMIGDYFLSMSDFLRSYTNYVNNYDNAVALMTRLEEDKKFVAFLKRLTDNETLKGLNLYSYLIMPVQRIPRYIMLFADLQRKTTDVHPDKDNLGKASEVCAEIARFVDSKKDEYDSQQQMLEVQKSIIGFPEGESLIVPGRAFVRDDDVCVGSDVNHVFLFSDSMCVTSQASSKHIKEEARKSKKEGKSKEDYSQLNWTFVRWVNITRGMVITDHADTTQYMHAITMQAEGGSILIMAQEAAAKKDWLRALGTRCKIEQG
eukprot:TRINITY_DN92_c0_g2_i1.p1 TRINITY_DN92_c0_g2~~TRINITY_DN92_c0_g2_i1.p1  ORF type:complete len:337 (-),score=117.74 TRINITY_DN92_c0_g2_i1:91-1101(-)